MGNSYAIPTKNRLLRVLSLPAIRGHVRDFLEHARSHPEDRFKVVKIGCGLAGYSEESIAPMFDGAPDNVLLPDGWPNAWMSNDGEGPDGE